MQAEGHSASEIDPQADDHLAAESTHNFGEVETHGFGAMLPVQELRDPKRGFLKDSCHFEVEVEVRAWVRPITVYQ